MALNRCCMKGSETHGRRGEHPHKGAAQDDSRHAPQTPPCLLRGASCGDTKAQSLARRPSLLLVLVFSPSLFLFVLLLFPPSFYLAYSFFASFRSVYCFVPSPNFVYRTSLHLVISPHSYILFVLHPLSFSSSILHPHFILSFSRSRSPRFPACEIHSCKIRRRKRWKKGRRDKKRKRRSCEKMASSSDIRILKILLF